MARRSTATAANDTLSVSLAKAGRVGPHRHTDRPHRLDVRSGSRVTDEDSAGRRCVVGKPLCHRPPYACKVDASTFTRTPMVVV